MISRQHRRSIYLNNKREQERQRKKSEEPIKNKSDLENFLSKVLAEIYILTEKAIQKEVTSSLDREALMKSIDNIFGKKKKDDKIIYHDSLLLR